MRPTLSAGWLLVGWLTIAMAAELFPRIDRVLEDEAMFKSYADCFLDRGKCGTEGRTIKRLLPEFIRTNCKRCMPRQKLSACKVIIFLQHKDRTNLWNDFLAKYDPEKVHRQNLGSFLRDCKALMQ